MVVHALGTSDYYSVLHALENILNNKFHLNWMENRDITARYMLLIETTRK